MVDNCRSLCPRVSGADWGRDGGCVLAGCCVGAMLTVPVFILCLRLSLVGGSIPVSLDGAINDRSGNMVADDRVTLNEGELLREETTISGCIIPALILILSCS